MDKKTGVPPDKKECPSCGLGVSLDANICEFCGWDFEEEDEWILQIEKLERDLMVEKQKFEPGTVDHKIESTLRTPSADAVQASQNHHERVEPKQDEYPSEVPDEPSPGEPEPMVAETRPDTAEVETAAPPEQNEAMVAREERSVETPESVPPAPAPKARRLRAVKETPPQESPTRPVASERPSRPVGGKDEPGMKGFLKGLLSVPAPAQEQEDSAAPKVQRRERVVRKVKK